MADLDTQQVVDATMRIAEAVQREINNLNPNQALYVLHQNAAASVATILEALHDRDGKTVVAAFMAHFMKDCLDRTNIAECEVREVSKEEMRAMKESEDAVTH